MLDLLGCSRAAPQSLSRSGCHWMGTWTAGSSSGGHWAYGMAYTACGDLLEDIQMNEGSF